MDFPVLLVIVAVIGSIKMFTGSPEVNRSAVTSVNAEEQVSNTTASVNNVAAIPIGNNLGLKKELDAYTAILKELGLKKV